MRQQEVHQSVFRSLDVGESEPLELRPPVRGEDVVEVHLDFADTFVLVSAKMQLKIQYSKICDEF